ncbi:hypothetical protein E2562_039372 [Oryza meyeriana var. granulata]|uniref:Retroviral polymerase SH3-like domain-containing protein n=1 Tax=Oryza meyeriana var. granulata TaxID=110450 RepID=A0A6G1CML5_9ORYZ|nr:hypothetical protein E2562_039372 [Oryza meyeriana var. granulata]
MIFVSYEGRSKAYRVYDPNSRRVHVTRDVVFDEGVSWDWDARGGGEQNDHDDFSVEYSVELVGSAAPALVPLGASNSTSATPLAPLPQPTTPQGSGVTPAAKPAPAQEDPIELVSPLTNFDNDDLDDDHDDVPLRFRTVDNLLSPALPPGLVERQVDAGELFFITAEEPSSFKEAEQHQS